MTYQIRELNSFKHYSTKPPMAIKMYALFRDGKELTRSAKRYDFPTITELDKATYACNKEWTPEHG